MRVVHAVPRSTRATLIAAAGALLIAVAAPVAAAAAPHPYVSLTPAETAFAKVFKTDMTNFAHAVDAATAPLAKLSGKSTVAQIVAATNSAGKAWTAAAKPLLALKCPPQLTLYWNLLLGYVRSGGTSLLAMAQAAHNGNEKSYLAAGQDAGSAAQGISTTGKLLAKMLGISLPALTV
jgi:hypothetical protein